MLETARKEEITTESPEQTRKVVKTSHTDAPPLEGDVRTPKVMRKKKSLFRVYQIIWYTLTVIEIILGFRVFLKFFGADPASGFANFIYTISSPLADPFRGVFQITPLSNAAIIEWSTFFAMFVYALLAYILTELIPIIKPVSSEEVDNTIDIE